MSVVSQRQVELNGGSGKPTNSARAGLMPISLERAPLCAFDGIAVYLRGQGAARKSSPRFTLLCSPRVEFTTDHRQSLRDHGVQFVYIKMADQERFRHQVEATLLTTMDDPSMSASVKSEILYQTSVGLIDELLSEPRGLAGNPRVERLSRAVTMLVLDDPKAFSHLFATSHHDFYTATHMVNVGTWMVPLAYRLGHRKQDELHRICLAGLLHDVGKVKIPPEVLNKKGRLSASEWQLIRQHPVLGCEYLDGFSDVHPLIRTVVRQHHERLDGSGYPDGLSGDAIDPISRICAVIDSFDAMTALRPFKQRTLSVAQALTTLAREAPSHYDLDVVEAWVGLLSSAEADGVLPDSLRAYDGAMHRRYIRFKIDCPARVHVLESHGQSWQEQRGTNGRAHNISRGGTGLLADKPVRLNENVRVYLLGRGTLRRSEEGITVRCRDFGDGWYDIGVRFRTIVNESDFSEMPRLLTPGFAAAQPVQISPSSLP